MIAFKNFLQIIMEISNIFIDMYDIHVTVYKFVSIYIFSFTDS